MGLARLCESTERCWFDIFCLAAHLFVKLLLYHKILYGRLVSCHRHDHLSHRKDCQLWIPHFNACFDSKLLCRRALRSCLWRQYLKRWTEYFWWQNTLPLLSIAGRQHLFLQQILKRTSNLQLLQGFKPWDKFRVNILQSVILFCREHSLYLWDKCQTWQQESFLSLCSCELQLSYMKWRLL